MKLNGPDLNADEKRAHYSTLAKNTALNGMTIVLTSSTHQFADFGGEAERSDG